MSYLAVIYDPTKERPPTDLIGGGWSPLRPPIYPFSAQIPENYELLSPTTLKTKNGGTADTLFIQRYKNVFFRPGVNPDILKADWDYLIKDKMIQWRLDNGAMVVVTPDQETVEIDSDGIGYRMYKLPDALKLVAYTKDLITLEEWASLEKRLEVQEAITQQKNIIERHIRMLKEN